MTPGQRAFEAYCRVVSNIAHTGRPIPPWTELPEHIQEGWEAGARAAVQLAAERLRQTLLLYGNAFIDRGEVVDPSRVRIEILSEDG